MALTTRERAVLDFERGWWREPGGKAKAIRARLGVSPTAYYALLRRTISSAEALEYDPLLVRRLRRRRAERRRAIFAPQAPLRRPR